MAEENNQENQGAEGVASSAKSSNPVTGRKVYFLNPTYTLRDHVITALWDAEYEVYIIEDYQYVKNVLRKNPDSILYINIDVQMNFMAWYAFIESIHNDKKISSTIVGVISDKLSDVEKDMFLTKTKCDAGFFSTKETIPIIVSSFERILDMYGAKGRRQYVRAMCMGGNASVLWQAEGKMFELPIVDISKVSCSIKLEERFLGYLKPGRTIPKMTLKLNGRVFSMDMKVYAVHQKGTAIMGVLLFQENLPPTTQASIKDFIHKILHKVMASSVNGEAPDKCDYALKGSNLAKEFQAQEDAKRREQRLKEQSQLRDAD
ncbi:MAG: hypothetical protein IKP51_12975 [Treponema sp.]|nr:hypothetical protein [Treponema sp.]